MTFSYTRIFQKFSLLIVFFFLNPPKLQKVPYRAVYPNAAESEWKLLKRETERTVNVLQLRDPNIEPGQFYAKFETADDQDDDEEDGGCKITIKTIACNEETD